MMPPRPRRPHARSLIKLAVVVVTAACSRPVLYYPTTEADPVPASAQPASAPAARAAAPSPLATMATPAPSAHIQYLAQRHILLPVAGADMSRVDDSFHEPRDGGERVHR